MYLLSLDPPNPPLILIPLKHICNCDSSSAEAERVFSLLTHIKTKYRNQSSLRSLEGLLNISFNKPELPLFNAKIYADKWVEEGHNPSDHRGFRDRPLLYLI